MRKHMMKACAMVVTVTLCLACQKDNTTEFSVLNEVSIKTEKTALEVTQFDTLKVNPVLTESMPNGDTFTYQWKMYPYFSDPNAGTIISKEKNLNVQIELPPNNYYIQYKVTNTKTGVSSFMLYTAVVNGKFYEGWLVSGNKAGKAQFSFIRSDDALFLSPSEDLYKVTYPGKALSAYTGIGTGLALIYFFTDQGAFRINANDFFQLSTTNGILPGAQNFTSNIVYGPNSGLYDQYIIKDGGLYAGFGPAFYPSEIFNPFSERFSGDYQLFPGIISSRLNSTFFYDNKYRRFMTSTALTRTLTVSLGSNTATYNLGNVGKTMIHMDYGAQAYNQDEFYFLMKDDANARYLYSLKGTAPGIAQAIGNSPEIENASSMATSSLLKQMYYATSNKIYLYDILANSSRLVYTFPASHTIADIKMLRTTSKRLVVAANQGANGEVYYFDLDNIGDFVGNTYAKKFTGFGEIVHLTFRKR